ncbi:hypothetical protein [Ammoniphilus sp. 3BR4]|uniref:hypothetical protein n=1 Tax=Ammoniphilus sp. 3BR4 TaxID=3158265 RepID=UPI003466F85D
MDEIKVMIGNEASKVKPHKKICVKTNITLESNILLHRLSMTVSKSKTALATEIIEIMLRNPSFITFLQDKYNVPKEHRLVVITKNGEVRY